MGPVCTGDDNSSPRPTENPATPPVQTDLPLLTSNGGEFDVEDPASASLPPSATSSQFAEKFRLSRLKLPRLKPLFRGFETPSFSRIAILTVLCFITYPAFCILKLVAKDKSLFAVRAIVSVWCSGVGFALGYILLKIGARHLEAATWATVIHMSHGGDGMKLRDLARGSDNPTSFVPAFHMFRSRFRDQGTARRVRKPYDKRPWFLFLAFFVILAVLAPLLPFIFGRIVNIKVFVRPQRKAYSEILIAGDLTEEEISRGRVGTRHLRPDPYTAEFVHGNDTVYFAQPSPSQFVSGGSGAGNFDKPPVMGVRDPLNNTLGLTNRNTPGNDTGAILRYPQWGIRIHCEKLPDPEVNMMIESPNTGYTYAFIPQDFLQGLFGVHGIDRPTIFAERGVSLRPGDTIPSNINTSTISFVAESPSTAPATLYSIAGSRGSAGWVTVETIFIQLNTNSTPSGRFSAYRNVRLPYKREESRIGYDAIVCVQTFEPWIIEAYNTSTKTSFALQIVEKQDNSTSLSPSGTIRGAQMEGARYLNRTVKEKDLVFNIVHKYAVDRFWEVIESEGSYPVGAYTPTPTIVSFTEGTGPKGYIELSPDRVAVFRARVDAVNVLPYLAGSGPVVAQVYRDETLAYATYKPWQLIILPALVLILGTIGELFVPTLPLDIPRREFGVYSWLALFQSQELQFEAANDLVKLMNLDELEEKFSDKRVKFVA